MRLSKLDGKTRRTFLSHLPRCKGQSGVELLLTVTARRIPIPNKTGENLNGIMLRTSKGSNKKEKEETKDVNDLLIIQNGGKLNGR